jgi:hypothetical protein
MNVLTLLVAISIGIMASSYVWAWRSGTVRETTQERYDHRFDRIVARIRRPG